jgi:hypothetical protein
VSRNENCFFADERAASGFGKEPNYVVRKYSLILSYSSQQGLYTYVMLEMPVLKIFQ